MTRYTTDKLDPRDYAATDLVVCMSTDGWSLHAPEATDAEIAAGDAPYILSGPGEPTADDYDRAFELFVASYLQPRAAEAKYETAAGWYDDYAAHIDTKHAGSVDVQAIDYAWLDDDDDAVIAARLMTEDDKLSRDEALSLVSLARDVRASAEEVEAALAEALDCARRGDATACLDALDEASQIESQHGEDTATQHLRDQLIAE